MNVADKIGGDVHVASAKECGYPADFATRALLWAQGGYYLLTGIWPLVSIESFQKVTGRKTDHLVTGDENDHWLVMTVGVLVTAIALSLLVAAWRRAYSVEVVVLAIGAALGLTGIDVIYVARRAIDPIYLVDAVLEVVLIVSWAALLVRNKRHPLSDRGTRR